MRKEKQIQEGLVLIGREWAQLRYKAVIAGTVTLEMIPSCIEFEEGRDYDVDYRQGRIRRTPKSRIPDWSKNVFFGKEDFDHTKVEAYENQSFTVFVSYQYETAEPRQETPYQFRALCPNFWEKLCSGKPVTYVVYGDSISTGAESTLPEHTYFARFSQALRQAAPQANLTCVNCALGGEDSRGGLKRLRETVYPLHPDLVTIAYGMNDQNKSDRTKHFVEPEEFSKNIENMIEQLRLHTQADICLITPCHPNPKWHWASGDTELYAQALREIAAKHQILLADVTQLWDEELKNGKTPESLLHNNINHPNDYGHAIYNAALCKHL